MLYLHRFYEFLGVIWGVNMPNCIFYALSSTITLGFVCFESFCRIWLCKL